MFNPKQSSCWQNYFLCCAIKKDWIQNSRLADKKQQERHTSFTWRPDAHTLQHPPNQIRPRHHPSAPCCHLIDHSMTTLDFDLPQLKKKFFQSIHHQVWKKADKRRRFRSEHCFMSYFTYLVIYDLSLWIPKYGRREECDYLQQQKRRERIVMEAK